MPTYRNDGDTIKIVTNRSGSEEAVKPGKTVQTLDILTDSDFTKTRNSPYWNPVKAVTSPTGNAATDCELTLQSDTKKITIINRSGETTTVYFQAKANIPGIPIPNGSTYKITDDPFYEKSTKLVFAFSGTVSSGITVIETE